MVPSAFTRSLIDEKPAVIWGIPFGYPARREIVVGVGRRRALVRGRGTVEGTFARALIDTDMQSATHEGEKGKKRTLSLRAGLKTRIPPKTLGDSLTEERKRTTRTY